LPGMIGLLGLTATKAEAQQSPLTDSVEIVEPILPVTQLLDIQPEDIQPEDIQPEDIQILQTLTQRYLGTATAETPLGEQTTTLTRAEFAVKLQQLIHQGESTLSSTEDLANLRRLQTNFAHELAALQGRVTALETRAAQLEAQAFATTTKLRGQVIMALNAGGFGGERILAPRGTTITRAQPNPTVIFRASVDLDTSFAKTDTLKIRLVTGSDGANDNAGGLLEPNLGSTLDFSIPGRNSQFNLGRLYYGFSPHSSLRLTLGSVLVAPDFVDKNRFANTSFLDFSSQAFVNNFILFPRAGGAGAALEWQPRGTFVRLRAVYISGDATDSLPENQQVLGGGGANDIRLFPTAGGGAEGGLFGDPYQGVVELELNPNRAFALRLQYSGGRVFGSNFRVMGVNTELALNRWVGVFGRYGYGVYPNTTLGTITPHYWMAGISLRDLGLPQAVAGLAVGQPFIESKIGNARQTNFEAFYNIPITRQIRLTPLIQVITNPANQSSNGPIVSGTLRAVFSF
jgi:hypothetical protein